MGKNKIKRLKQADGFRGIWYFNQKSNDEYAFKYSGGLGTYCAKHIPFAIYSPEVNKTFFCYGGRKKNKNVLLHMISYFDHNSNQVCKPYILLNKKTNDAHDNPTLLIDDKGFIWIFSSSHGLSRPSFIHKSLKPYSIEEFERIKKTNFSYPQCWFVKNKGFFFLYTKYIDKKRTMCQMTSKNGRNWSEPKILSQIQKGHYQISGVHTAKIGTAFNMHPQPIGLNARTNLYYMETNDFGDTWHTISGEKINVPLKDALNEALVYDFNKEKKLVYLKDITFDSAGNPIILFLLSNGYDSGPKNNPRIWKIAYWNDEKWNINGTIKSDSNYDTGCIYCENDNKWIIVGPTGIGPQPFNPGGEIELWESTDKGLSWKKKLDLTQNSKYNHTYVRKVLNVNPQFYCIWADGNPRMESKSRIFFYNKVENKTCMLPEKISEDFKEPAEKEL